MNSELIDNIERFKIILEAHATGGASSNEEYVELRKILLVSEISTQLPAFVRQRRNLSEFWQYIKSKFGTYQERRDYIREAFSPILDFLESGSPEQLYKEAKVIFSKEAINSDFRKAFHRTTYDPEGAITLARTLIESTCKHILEVFGEEVPDDGDINKLYKMAAKLLSLAPSQHEEQVFRQILSGIRSIVFGLGELRNKLGDAHGKISNYKKPSTRHARLAVTSASSLCMFLLETLEYATQKDKSG